MNKRLLIAFCLAFSVLISGNACSNKTEVQNETASSSSKKAEDKKTSSSAVEESSGEEEKSSEEKEVLQEEGDLGNYHIKINDAVESKDDSGQSMLVVHYDFTNNGKEIDTPYWAIVIEAYQDDVGLSEAFATGNPDYDNDKKDQEVPPGETVEDCQMAFVLNNTSDVEVRFKLLVDPESGKLGKTFKLK